jgi:hypothetical protein
VRTYVPSTATRSARDRHATSRQAAPESRNHAAVSAIEVLKSLLMTPPATQTPKRKTTATMGIARRLR